LIIASCILLIMNFIFYVLRLSTSNKENDDDDDDMACVNFSPFV